MSILKKYDMQVKGSSKVLKTSSLWQVTGNFLSVINKDLKDHSTRVAYYMLEIATRLKVNPILKRKLVFAAYFHDIGKFMKESDNPILDGYLFLRYESPLKGLSKMVLYQKECFKKDSHDPMKMGGTLIHLCNLFDELYMEKRDKKKVCEEMLLRLDLPEEFIEASDMALKNIDIEYILNSKIYEQILEDYIVQSNFMNLHSVEFVTMLSSLFEMYNEVTLIHSKMTAEIAWMLAVNMNLDSIRGYKIYAAGLVHDLGKIYIPLEILDKPGKLTDSEYEVMKTHVTYTKSLLDHYLDTDIVEICYRHHERMDGSGYPNHIKASDMTMDQEILQVADVISALVAKRSYKEAFQKEKVIEIMEDNVRKNWLSSDAVQSFKENADEILARANELYVDAAKLNEKIEKERRKELAYFYERD